MPSDTQDSRVIAEWDTRPFTDHKHRRTVVNNRVKVVYYSDTGTDVRHEVECPERGVVEWTAAKVWEFRPYGIDTYTTEAAGKLP